MLQIYRFEQFHAIAKSKTQIEIDLKTNPSTVLTRCLIKLSNKKSMLEKELIQLLKLEKELSINLTCCAGYSFECSRVIILAISCLEDRIIKIIAVLPKIVEHIAWLRVSCKQILLEDFLSEKVKNFIKKLTRLPINLKKSIFYA